MPDYQNSKIYKIVDNTNGNIYVGSTTEKYLSKRLQRHLSNYNQHLKGNYCNVSSFEILKNNNYHIELIENVNCNDVYELRNRERYYIENCECINKYIPNRTREERKNTEEYQIKNFIIQKKYREKHKDKIKEIVLCECGCEIRQNNLSRHKKTKKHLDLVLTNV